ncbi:MAG: hypothetical protein ABL962_09400 [Fimbriimonadaceae bacterium]
MIVELKHPSEDVRIMIEDDGRVCYAYFMKGAHTTGHVWLYNVSPAPSSIEEQERGVAPLNPAPLVKAIIGPRPTRSEDIEGNWLINEENAVECGIYIFGHLTARLADGERPGYCSNAAEDGPLAFTYE